jgi:hypothetical protein
MLHSWFQPLYYGLKYHEQSEKPPSSYVIRHGRQAFFFEAALTNCGILIVDCKTEN